MGVFSRIFAALAGEAGEPDRLIIDSTHLRAHRTAVSLLKRGRLIDASGAPSKGGLNSRLHVICGDGQGRPIVMMLFEGQMNDQQGPTSLPRCCRLRAS